MYNKSIFGLMCILGWCFFSALARVIISNVSQKIDPVILCFYTFLLSTILFILLNIRNTTSTLLKLKTIENRRNVYGLNVSTFGAWFFLIYPLKYIEPAIVSTITLGLGPIATLILTAFIYKGKKLNYSDIVISSLLLLVILYAIYLSFSGVTTLGRFSFLTLTYSTLSCLIVGFATSAGNLYAKKLSNNHFSAKEILASRFLLTVILAGLILLAKNGNFFVPISDWNDIIIVTICLVVIPLYLVQISIKQLEPIIVSLVAPLMPALVFVFQLLKSISSFSPASALVVTATSVLVLSGVYTHYKKDKLVRYQLKTV
ncbi:MAG: hypothetical protein EPO11_02950 [Gammaproteobacteria bacterium]|nr:MAG: hypothetical protein EPO11_02950 [Gammaproteobacteria bacterium]